MGRRRSKVLETQRRSRHASDRFRKAKMKPRNYECPWCHTYGQMFSRYADSGRTVILGCTACQKGEKFPRHPSWRVLDFYHMCIDNMLKGTIPTFKFEQLTDKQFEFLRENVTLGKIICNIISDEDDEEEEVEEEECNAQDAETPASS